MTGGPMPHTNHHRGAARAGAVRRGLALCATAGVLASVLSGCATTPGKSEWPMVPAQRAATTELPAAETAAQASPVVDDPNPVAAAAGPDHEDLFDRIRAGYRLPEIEHARIDQKLRFYAARPEFLDRVFERAERYLYYVVGELEERDMPLEIALLPVVESAYNPYAYSRARAAGLWQFIPPTAALYQVRVNWWQDGRRDVVDSTRAALDYLQTLNRLFDGDWWLTLAAYNCGDGCVRRAIERNRAAGLPADYWSLRLPEETRNYVPKLIAMARVVGEPEAHGLAFAPIANLPYFARVEVGSQIDLRLAAQLAGVTEDELHALNPAFNRWATDPDGPHHLLVPFGTAPQFADAIARLSAEQRMPLDRHVVGAGETVASLAKARDVSPVKIKRLNGLTTTNLRAGDGLLLPASSVAPLRAGLVIEGESPASLRAGGRTSRSYVVRRGDTLWGIARQHGISVRDLARANGLTTQSRLPTGKRLTIDSRGPRVAQASGAAGRRTTSASAEAARRVSYVVRKGDTLHRISRRFAVTVAQLQRWNGLPGSALRPGQRLVVYLDSRRGSGDLGG